MGIGATAEMIGQAGNGDAPLAAATPKHWWQWVLLYPAAAGALFTAAPQWIDKVQAAYAGISRGSLAESERQDALWQKNIACLERPSPVGQNNPSNVRVYATVCRSGDVLIRASTPDNRDHFEWIELDRVLHRSGGSLIPEAKAATLSAGFGALRRAPGQSSDARLLRAAYQPLGVVCQRFVGQRRLLRHVRTQQGCFDEIIDTRNGSVVQRVPVACRGGC